MYYRIAAQTQSSQCRRWVSTTLRSMIYVKQWLLHYRACPSTRLCVFRASDITVFCAENRPASERFWRLRRSN
jgi:hypothetical protein